MFIRKHGYLRAINSDYIQSVRFLNGNLIATISLPNEIEDEIIKTQATESDYYELLAMLNNQEPKAKEKTAQVELIKKSLLDEVERIRKNQCKTKLDIPPRARRAFERIEYLAKEL